MSTPEDSPASSASNTATRALLSALARKRPPTVSPPTTAGALVAAALVGAAAAPSVIEPEVVGTVTHWGGWPLESAFAGIVLVACVATFRVGEILYRSHDAAALRMLPLAGGAVAWDRLRLAILESIGGIALVSAFIAPAAMRSGGGAPVLAALGFGAVAALVIPLVAFGTVVSAGVAAVDEGSVAAKSVGGGSTASTSAAFHMAPGAAFGAAAALLLLCKLGIEEPLRVFASTGVFEFTRAAWFGIGLPLAIAAGGAAYALRGYAHHHDALQARFIDAESHRVDTGYAYFREGHRTLSRLETRLGPVVALLYRKDRLQLARTTPFLRVGTWLVAVIALFTAWAGRETISPATLGLVLGAWVAVIASPHRRLSRLPGEERFGLGDMLAPSSHRQIARAVAAAREVGVHTLPLIGVGIGLGMSGLLPVAAVVTASAASHVVASVLLAPTELNRVMAFTFAAGSTSAALAVGPLGALVALIWVGAALAALMVAPRRFSRPGVAA